MPDFLNCLLRSLLYAVKNTNKYQIMYLKGRNITVNIKMTQQIQGREGNGKETKFVPSGLETFLRCYSWVQKFASLLWK